MKCRSIQLRTLLVLAIGVVIFFTIGCERRQAANVPGRVAVVDMAKVAHTTGFDQQLNAKMSEAQQAEQTQLQQLQKKLGLTPPVPGENGAQLNAQSEQQFRAAVVQAQQRLESLQAAELQKFHNMIRPIAEQIANMQGCSIVMDSSDNFISIDPASDITEQVIAKMPKIDLSQGPTPFMAPPLTPSTPTNRKGNSQSGTPATEPTGTTQPPL